MTIRKIFLTLGAALIATQAARAEVYTNEQGQKIECNPVTTTTTTQKDAHPVIGTVAGAVVGGAVGHQFGGGAGKDAATGLGAAGGAVAGHHLGQGQNQTQTTQQEKCQPVSG